MRSRPNCRISRISGRRCSVPYPTLPILPYDEPAAAWHAEVRAQRERLGRPIAFADGQIAAIAHVHSLVVVTANVADFDGLEGVAVENWIAL